MVRMCHASRNLRAVNALEGMATKVIDLVCRLSVTSALLSLFVQVLPKHLLVLIAIKLNRHP